MPPVRRARRATRSGHGGEAPMIDLPDDVLFAIFCRVPGGAADVARCAATCRRWGRVVAARAPAISRALPPPGRLLPHMALGFLHRQDKRARGRAQLRFVPTAAFAASRHHRQLLVDDEAAAGARPVASRNGRVVLELRRASGGLTALSVWNPMTGDASVLPPVPIPGYDYACALLTADDLAAADDDDASASSPSFFRLLLVYNHRSFTALRSYDSASSGSWGPEATKPGAKISDRALRQLGPAAVLRGVAYWPMRHEAFGVRLDDGSMDVCSLPYLLTYCDADQHVLSVSPVEGGTLRCLGVCFTRQTTLTIAFLTTQLHGNNGFCWEPVLDQHVRVPGVRVTRTTAFKLRWFGEKSGTLLFTVGDAGGSTSAVFALNISTGALEKLAEGDGYHACRDMCGYEMDRAALLASVPPR